MHNIIFINFPKEAILMELVVMQIYFFRKIFRIINFRGNFIGVIFIPIFLTACPWLIFREEAVEDDVVFKPFVNGGISFFYHRVDVFCFEVHHEGSMDSWRGPFPRIRPSFYFRLLLGVHEDVTRLYASPLSFIHASPNSSYPTHHSLLQYQATFYLRMSTPYVRRNRISVHPNGDFVF